MSVIQKRFTSYDLHYLSNSTAIYGTRYSNAEVTLNVSNNQEGYIGRIHFREEFPVRANFIDVNNFINIHYHINRFNDIINILRYEKPLYIYIETVHYGGGISTESERVGDQEP